MVTPLWVEAQANRVNVGSVAVPRKDTLVVAGGQYAWSMYGRYSAYLGQLDRPFRDVDYLAFYADGEIKDRIAAILARRDEVHIRHQTLKRLSRSADLVDYLVADLVEQMLADEVWVGNRNQVFLLSGSDDARTLKLPNVIKNVKRDKHGKPVAYTFGQTYTASQVLATGPRTTAELASRGG